MAAPLKHGGTFAPTDIASMSKAYDLAMEAAGADSALLEAMPGSVLKHRIASLIIADASGGPIDVERAAERALRGILLLSAAKPNLSGFLTLAKLMADQGAHRRPDQR